MLGAEGFLYVTGVVILTPLFWFLCAAVHYDSGRYLEIGQDENGNPTLGRRGINNIMRRDYWKQVDIATKFLNVYIQFTVMPVWMLQNAPPHFLIALFVLTASILFLIVANGSMTLPACALAFTFGFLLAREKIKK